MQLHRKINIALSVVEDVCLFFTTLRKKKLAIFFVVLEAKRVSYAPSSKHGFYNKYFGQF